MSSVAIRYTTMEGFDAQLFMQTSKMCEKAGHLIGAFEFSCTYTNRENQPVIPGRPCPDPSAITTSITVTTLGPTGTSRAGTSTLAAYGIFGISIISRIKKSTLSSNEIRTLSSKGITLSSNEKSKHSNNEKSKLSSQEKMNSNTRSTTIKAGLLASGSTRSIRCDTCLALVAAILFRILML